MPRPVRAYTHRESADAFLPRDVLWALGEPMHVRQGRLLVFATTAEAAYQLCQKVGVGVRGPRHLAVAHDIYAEALRIAGLGVEGSVFALPRYRNVVVDLIGGDGVTPPARIGEICDRVFVPAQDKARTVGSQQ